MHTQISGSGMLGVLRSTRAFRRVTSFIAARAALAIGMLLCAAIGCGNPAASPPDDALGAVIGPQGGEIVGEEGSALEGVKLTIPAGALARDTRIEIKLAADDTPLPATAVPCGPMVAITPAGIQLAVAARLTLPFDENIVAGYGSFDGDVKVWVREGDHWSQKRQVDSAQGSVTIELSTLNTAAAGVNPLSPSEMANHYESVSGFPFRATDRMVPWAQFQSMLQDAVVNLPGPLAAARESNDLNAFLQQVHDNTPAHRINPPTGGVRLVQVYSDAPVYLIGSYAILPDANGVPVDPTQFRHTQGSRVYYVTAAVNAFCAADQTSRCIALYRTHPSNPHTALILLAARNIIVKGLNFTDGLSLVAMTENLLMPEVTDRLDLSPGGQGQSAYNPTPLPDEKPDLITEGPVAAPAGTTGTPDLQWQLEHAKALVRSSSSDNKRGLSGLSGGSLFILTFRVTPVRAILNGQRGSNGKDGDPVPVNCTSGTWQQNQPNEAYTDVHCYECDTLHTLFPCMTPTFPHDGYCQAVCGAYPGTNPDGSPLQQNGGPAGPPGASGLYFIYSATQTSNCGPYSEYNLRDDDYRSRDPNTQFDLGEGLNASCTDNCSDSCNSDVNVTVCGTRERSCADAADGHCVGTGATVATVGMSHVTTNLAHGGTYGQLEVTDATRAVQNVNLPLPGGVFSAGIFSDPSNRAKLSSVLASHVHAGLVTPASLSLDRTVASVFSPAAIQSLYAPIHIRGASPSLQTYRLRTGVDLGQVVGSGTRITLVGGAQGHAIEQVAPQVFCIDDPPPAELIVGGGSPPAMPGRAGGSPTAICYDPSILTITSPPVGTPVHCGAPSDGSPGEPAQTSGFPPLVTDVYPSWSRLQWSIALDRLHPMEISRRLAVADHRFKQGEYQAAKTRYLETEFIIEANQRRVESGRTADGRVFNCTVDGATPAGLQEICALRLETDGHVRSLNRGENFFGYPPKFIPPNSIGSAKWVQFASDELNNAQTAVNTWSINARLQYLAQDVSTTWNTDVDTEIANLTQTYQGSGGSLTVELTNAQQDKSAALVELAQLHTRAQQINAALGTLQLPNQSSSFTFADLEKFVITKAVTFAVAAVAPEAAGAAFALSEAMSQGLDNDLSVTGAHVFNTQQDAQNWINGFSGPIANAIPLVDANTMASGSDSDAAKALKRSQLTDQAVTVALQERESSRRLGQAIHNIELVNAKILEAKASVMRLQANKAQFTTNRYGLAYLDEMLKAQFTTAAERVQRAGELAFLTKRATEHDLVTFKVESSGSLTNELTALLNSDPLGLRCGGVDSDSVDIRFEGTSLTCFTNRVNRLNLLLSSQSQAFPFNVQGHVTVVVPITQAMLDPTGTLYVVPVDLALDTIQNADPLYANTRAHRLTDISIFVDTGATGTVPGVIVRDRNEVFWLGPTAASSTHGGDIHQFLRWTYALGGPSTNGVLWPLFASPEFKLVPPLTMSFCRGSPTDNQNLISGSTQIPLACQLSNFTQERPAYLGRAALGRYTFTVAASDLSGSSALRVDFQFIAKN